MAFPKESYCFKAPIANKPISYLEGMNTSPRKGSLYRPISFMLLRSGQGNLCSFQSRWRQKYLAITLGDSAVCGSVLISVVIRLNIQ